MSAFKSIIAYFQGRENEFDYIEKRLRSIADGLNKVNLSILQAEIVPEGAEASHIIEAQRQRIRNLENHVSGFNKALEKSRQDMTELLLYFKDNKLKMLDQTRKAKGALQLLDVIKENLDKFAEGKE